MIAATFLVIHFFALSSMVADPLMVSALVQTNGCNNASNIVVSASGGLGGGYSYSIQCVGQPLGLPQSSNVFTGVPPCTYLVTVTSGSETATTTVTVPPNAPALNLNAVPLGCAIDATATGGVPPYTYFIGSVSNTGPWGSGQGNGSFTGLALGTYFVRVVDACMQEQVRNVVITGSGGLYFQRDFTDTQVCITDVNGPGPYSFTLTSTMGTFNSPDGCFDRSLLGCGDYSLEVAGDCVSGKQTYTNSLYAYPDCVRFRDGHVELIAGGGTPPFTYTVYAGGQTFSNNTGIFENLPHPVSSYSFMVEDACGRVENDFGINAYSLAFPAMGSCQSDTLTANVVRGCQHGYHFDEPVMATCPFCNQSDTLNYSSDELQFTGMVPGNINLHFTTACNDTFRCRDTLVLHLTPSCDSIKARIADLFLCDYFMQSIRWMADTGVLFSLYDATGQLIATNSNGIFSGLAFANNYKVVAESPTCGTFSATVDLPVPQPVNINWAFRVNMSYVNGQCVPSYYLRTLRGQGAQLLTGGPDQVQIPIDDENVTYDCRYYHLYNIKPGIYQLHARVGCNAIQIELPELPFDVHADLVSDCPGNGSIRVSGAKSMSEWSSFFGTYHIAGNWDSEGFSTGGYALVDSSGNTVMAISSVSGPWVVDNLTPGHYTVVHKIWGCTTDTAAIWIPEKPPLGLSFTPGVICDGASTATVIAKIRPGRPPYQLNRVDCFDKNIILGNFPATMDTAIIVSGLTAGTHCFILKDSCGNAVDYTLGVGPFTDEIIAIRQCVPAQVLLQLDSFPDFIYDWRDGQGHSVGNQSGLHLSYPLSDSLFTVNITLPATTCLITKSYIFEDLNITPTFSISTWPAILCNPSDTATVSTAAQETYAYEWSNGGQQAEQSLPAGTYTVTATDISSGCTALQTVEVGLAPVVLPEIVGDFQFCAHFTTTLQVANATQFSSLNWSNGTAFPTAVFDSTQIVTITATDSLGCVRSDTVAVEEMPSPVMEVDVDTLICIGTQTALHIVAINSQPLNYFLNGNAIAPTNTSLGQGTYSLIGVDSNGCSDTIGFYVVEKNNPQVSILPEKQYLCPDDTLALHGVADQPVQYLWGHTTLDTNWVNIEASGQYNVTVVDSEGCKDTAYIQIYSVDVPQTTLEVDLLSNGYALQCHGDSSAVVHTSVQGGMPPFLYRWSTGATTNHIEGVPAGIYELTLTDEQLCTHVYDVQVTSPPKVQLYATGESPKCYGKQGGAIHIDVTGNDNTYYIFLNDTLVGTVPSSLSNLDTGQYSVRVSDAACPDLDTVLLLTMPPKYTFSFLDSIKVVSLGEAFTLVHQTDIPEITQFSWNKSLDGLVPTVVPTHTTIYSISITDSNGCTYQDQIRLDVDKENLIVFPNVITPVPIDDNFINGAFFPSAKPGAVERLDELAIFDRWGAIVFRQNNFLPNDPSMGWNGSVGGATVGSAVFTWMAKVSLIDGQQLVLSGDVTVLR